MSADNVCPITELTKILLATDGSAYSDKALAEALGLAKTCNTVFHALAIVEQNPEYAALAPKAIEQADKDARAILDGVRERAAAEGVACETDTLHGQDVAGLIVDHAEKIGANMIVMGRQGRKKGLKKLLLGSTTSAVISHAPCKVLVVP
jgi:nucleotide-binding universal stress UspA family protein